jgi:membrane protein DedA with SNARE-associated domain
MSLLWAGAAAVVFSVLGDLAGYGLGRVLGREFFERRGRWLGLTPALRAKVEIFFQKWGILTVVLSRSLLSFKSSAVNLLAGGKPLSSTTLPAVCNCRPPDLVIGLSHSRLRIRCCH